MNRFKRPLQVNGMLILAVLLLAFTVTGMNNADEVPFLVGTFMLLLAPVNLVVGMVRNRNRKPDGMAYIIFAGVLLLVGFSTCGAGLALGNLNFH